jgi:hypothetical protein
MCSIIISGKVFRQHQGLLFMHHVKLIKDMHMLFSSVDIVALRQRAKYHAITGIVFALATSKYADIICFTSSRKIMKKIPPLLIIYLSLGSTYWRFLR